MRLAITCLTVTALAGLLAGCTSEQEPSPAETGGFATSDAAPEPKLPTIAAEAPIGRAEFLAAAAAAADGMAAGQPLLPGNLKLANRSFRLRLPFGCGDGLGEWGTWHLDPKSRVLRISVQPQVWEDDPTFTALAGGMAYDTAEGFWIERPWTRSEKCPPAAGPGPWATGSPAAEHQPDTLAQMAKPNQTLALVQYFSPDEPRTLRRGSRPYSFTAKVPQDRIAQARAFRLHHRRPDPRLRRRPAHSLPDRGGFEPAALRGGGRIRPRGHRKRRHRRSGCRVEWLTFGEDGGKWCQTRSPFSV